MEFVAGIVFAAMVGYVAYRVVESRKGKSSGGSGGGGRSTGNQERK